MNNKNFNPLVKWWLITPLLATSPALLAQGTLEEVVVVAQKRTQNIQDVPIAISAFTENFLIETGIGNTLELAMVTPGLSYGKQLVGGVPFIRGIGTQDTSAGQDSAVSSYIDEVYISTTVGNVMTLKNVERIEVLKGPQGTLFGRNATGGLIHVITKTPSQETSGTIEASYGNYDTTALNLYGTTGLTDSIATDLAVYYYDQADGWGENIATGNDINKSEELLIRNKWAISAGDRTDISLSFDYVDTETNLGISQRMYPGALGADGLIVYQVLTLLQGLPPEVAAPLAAAQATTYSGEYYDINSSIDPKVTLEQWGAAMKIVHEFNDTEFVSITAYRDNDWTNTFSQPQVPLPGILDPVMPQFVETLTQEFRLSGSYDSIDWIVGAYLLDEDAGFDKMSITGLGVMQISPLPLSEVIIDDNQETFSWSLFGQATWGFTERAALTVGLRYTDDERQLSGTTSGLAGDTVLAAADYKEKASFDETTWRLALEHQFSDDMLAYVSYNRGFKSGLYNTIVSDPINGATDPVEPEVLDAYEVGLKSEFLDRRLRLNMAAFYYEYDNLQAQVTSAGAAVLLNAAKASMSGGEIDLQAAVTDNFQIHAGLSLLDTEYDDFPLGQSFIPTGYGGNNQVTRDLSGNEVVRSPDYTANVGFAWDLPTQVGLFTTSMNYYYNDGFYWESENRIEEDSYAVLNALVQWNSNQESFYVQVYGNNLTDEEYGAFGISGQLGDQLAVSAPRTYGVRLGYNF